MDLRDINLVPRYYGRITGILSPTSLTLEHIVALGEEGYCGLVVFSMKVPFQGGRTGAVILNHCFIDFTMISVINLINIQHSVLYLICKQEFQCSASWTLNIKVRTG